MTFAWYGHLKYTEIPLWKAILVAWGIAFFEYCLMIPANRFGASQFSVFQLKIMQEVITLVVFTLFAVFFLKQQVKWEYILAFIFILAAVLLVFKTKV